jgi:hypothetical protein
VRKELEIEQLVFSVRCSARFDDRVLNWSVESIARELAVWQRALRPAIDFFVSAVFCEDPMQSFEVRLID